MNTGACLRCLTTRSSSALAEDRQRARRAGDDDVELAQAIGQFVQRDRFGAQAARRAGLPRSSVRLATVIDLGFFAAKCVAASSIISPAPINSSRCSAMRREDALGELDRRRRHGDRRAADVGLRAHVLGDGERALEQPVQDQPERARGFRRAHRLLHLAQDLRLAQHHRIESARHAEGVRHRLVLRQRVDIRRSEPCGRSWKPASQCATGSGSPPWK